MNTLAQTSTNNLQKPLENYFWTNINDIIMIFLVLVILWLLLREVRNWYWKHNKMVSLLREIRDEIHHLSNKFNKEEKIKIALKELVKKRRDLEDAEGRKEGRRRRRRRKEEGGRKEGGGGREGEEEMIEDKDSDERLRVDG